MSTPWWQVAWSPPLKRGSQHSFHEPLEEWRREFTTYSIPGSAWWTLCTLKITGLFLPPPRHSQVQRGEGSREGRGRGSMVPPGSSAGLLPRGGSISVSFWC